MKKNKKLQFWITIAILYMVGIGLLELIGIHVLRLAIEMILGIYAFFVFLFLALLHLFGFTAGII